MFFADDSDSVPSDGADHQRDEELYNQTDQNQNEEVDYLEYATWIFQSVKHLPDKFAGRLDKNGDDVLDIREFKAALELLAWYRISRKTPQHWVTEADKIKSGELETDEIQGLVRIGHSGDSAAKKIPTFNKLDKDQSGCLRVEEYQVEYQDAIMR